MLSNIHCEETTGYADWASQRSDFADMWTAEQAQDLRSLRMILERKDSKSISAKLFEKCITSGIDEAPEPLRILLRHNAHPIDECFLKMAMHGVHRAEHVAKLLSYSMNLIISEHVMLEAANNFDSAVMEVLLSHKKHAEVTEQLINAAVGQRQPNMVKLLLQHSGDLAITEEILALAAERDCEDAPITRMLLSYQEMLITTRVVQGALRSQDNAADVLQVLLAHRLKAPLDQRVADEACALHASHSKVMTILADFGCSISPRIPSTGLEQSRVDEIEDFIFMLTLETQSCPTCYSLSEKSTCTWEELDTSVNGGCRFCCVVRDGATKAFGQLRCETRVTMIPNRSERPFEVQFDLYNYFEKSLSFYMHEAMSA